MVRYNEEHVIEELIVVEIEHTAQIIGKRYRVIQQLGVGGMGTVYEARDLLNDTSVALKRVSPGQSVQSEDHRLALAQEFKTLASLRHPHIISVRDYGFDSHKGHHLPFYTMDLLPNMRTILEAGRGQPIPQRVTYLIEMLQALAYLHRRGILHRDLKPANVAVTGGNEVKVLDFGLATARDQYDRGAVVGTLAYMSPEVLQGEAPSEASDLYAVGIIAYELFTDRHPFTIDEPTMLINDIIIREPDLTQIDADVALVEVIRRLVAKRHADRFPNAEAVIYALATAIGQPIPETEEIRESFLQAATFIGREDELNVLTAALDSALEGEGSAWLIGGESGIGKSRLLDELRTRALVDGALVIRGQALANVGISYQVWRDVLRWLLLLTEEVTDEEAGIIKMFLPDTETVLGRQVPDAPAMTMQDSAARLLSTITLMFQRQTQTVVLILEDLQWASDSLEVLKSLVREVGDLPVLILGSYRNDERPDLPEQLPQMGLIELPRLTQDEIGWLSRAMIGEAGTRRSVVDLLYRETEGNIFFIVEVMRALAKEFGHLSEIGQRTLPEHVFAGGMQRIIAQRLAQLTPQDRDLLEIAAISGRYPNLAVILTLRPEANLERWLQICTNNAILEVEENQWRFVHDKLRDTLLKEVDEARQVMLHRDVAETIELLYTWSLDEWSVSLAWHWHKAGDDLKERQYAQRAGDQALLTSSYAEAIRHYQRALELHTEDEDKVALLVKLGNVHMLNDFNAAKDYLRRAAFLARQTGDYQQMAYALTQLGRLALIRDGDLEQARFYQQDALTAARAAEDPASLSTALLQMAQFDLITGNETSALHHLSDSAAAARAGQDDIALAMALSALSMVQVRMGEADAALETVQQIVSISEHLNNRRLMMLHAMHRGYIHLYQRNHVAAQVHFIRAQDLARQIDDREYLGRITNYLGDCLLGEDNLPEARHLYTEAVRLCLQSNLLPELLKALSGLAAVWHSPEHAVEVLTMVFNHPACTHETYTLRAPLLEALRARLGEEAVRTATQHAIGRDPQQVARQILITGTLD
ncbi:MAG: hypothetical protein OHK0046_19080 [Anaerolineae bacterium]